MMDKKTQLQEIEKQLTQIILSTFNARKNLIKELEAIRFMKRYLGFPDSIYAAYLIFKQRLQIGKLNSSIKKMVKQKSNLRLAILLAH